MTPAREQLIQALQSLHEKLAIAIRSNDINQVRHFHEMIHLTREALHELETLLKSQQVQSPHKD